MAVSSTSDQAFSALLARAFAVGTADRVPAARIEEEEIAYTLGAIAEALRHADLAEVVPTDALLDVTPEECQRGIKSVLVGSAQHEALWALTMLAQVKREPARAAHYLDVARQCAELALDAPVAEIVTGSGIKAVREVEIDGQVGLLTKGYASRYGECDLGCELMAPGCFDGIHQEWAADERPPILWDHGLDPAIRQRPLGYATGVKSDDVGLYVEAFVPREGDPRRFSGAALRRRREVYDQIRTRQVTGYSVKGSRLLAGTTNRWWSTSEVSITGTPCLPGARFTLTAGA